MKIDQKKKYSLLEIVRDGLLLNTKTGKPMTSLNGVRLALMRQGIEGVRDKRTGLISYLISGKTLAGMNKERKQ